VFVFEARDLGAEPVDLGLGVPDDGHARFHTSQQAEVEVPGLLRGEGVRVQVAERGESFFGGQVVMEAGFHG
jgi:hypothetical protein